MVKSTLQQEGTALKIQCPTIDAFSNVRYGIHEFCGNENYEGEKQHNLLT
jgi:hypothetical protein